MTYITFDDIGAALETDAQIPSMKGTARIRALDPIEVLEYVERIQRESEAANSSKPAFLVMREVVVKGAVNPALDAESVKKVPARVLIDFFNAIVKHSGVGDETQAEADKFREQPAGADGSPAVQ